MRLRDGVLTVPPAGSAGPSLVLIALLGFGCVSLDKPEVVENCASNGGCQNGPGALGEKDAAEDVAGADVQSPDDPAATEDDLTADLGKVPDAERADSSIDGRDASGTEAASDGLPSDPPPGSDRGPDVAADRATDEGVETTDAGKNDVSKDDVTEDDLIKDDVLKVDVERDDVAKDDVTKLDVEGPEAPLDVPPEVGITNCAIFFGASPSTGSQGHPPPAGTAASCMATCDDISGWDCANKDGRTITVNGTTVSCGAPITKKSGYFVFQLGAGSNRDFAIFWWTASGQWATSCTAPPDGFYF